MPAESLVQIRADTAKAFVKFSGASIEKVFRAIDTNCSGRLDIMEVTRGLDRLGVLISTKNIQRMFSALDADGSGQIETMEFVKCFSADATEEPPPAATTPTPAKAKEATLAKIKLDMEAVFADNEMSYELIQTDK